MPLAASAESEALRIARRPAAWLKIREIVAASPAVAWCKRAMCWRTFSGAASTPDSAWTPLRAFGVIIVSGGGARTERGSLLPRRTLVYRTKVGLRLNRRLNLQISHGAGQIVKGMGTQGDLLSACFQRHADTLICLGYQVVA